MKKMPLISAAIMLVLSNVFATDEADGFPRYGFQRCERSDGADYGDGTSTDPTPRTAEAVSTVCEELPNLSTDRLFDTKSTIGYKRNNQHVHAKGIMKKIKSEYAYVLNDVWGLVNGGKKIREFMKEKDSSDKYIIIESSEIVQFIVKELGVIIRYHFGYNKNPDIIKISIYNQDKTEKLIKYCRGRAEWPFSSEKQINSEIAKIGIIPDRNDTGAISSYLLPGNEHDIHPGFKFTDYRRRYGWKGSGELEPIHHAIFIETISVITHRAVNDGGVNVSSSDDLRRLGLRAAANARIGYKEKNGDRDRVNIKSEYVKEIWRQKQLRLNASKKKHEKNMKETRRMALRKSQVSSATLPGLV